MKTCTLKAFSEKSRERDGSCVFFKVLSFNSKWPTSVLKCNKWLSFCAVKCVHSLLMRDISDGWCKGASSHLLCECIVYTFVIYCMYLIWYIILKQWFWWQLPSSTTHLCNVVIDWSEGPPPLFTEHWGCIYFDQGFNFGWITDIKSNSVTPWPWLQNQSLALILQ